MQGYTRTLVRRLMHGYIYRSGHEDNVQDSIPLSEYISTPDRMDTTRNSSASRESTACGDHTTGYRPSCKGDNSARRGRNLVPRRSVVFPAEV